MDAYVEKALEYHHKGFNCAQAVVCAFSDELGMDEVSLCRTFIGFGSGMGDMQDTCGAVSGMAGVASLFFGKALVPPFAGKKELYKRVSSMKNDFKAKNQTTICRELRGIDTGKPINSCDGCIEDAVRIVASQIGLANKG